MRGKIRFLTIVFVFMSFILNQKYAHAFTSISHWDSDTEAGWRCIDRDVNGHKIDSATDTPDQSNALKQIYTKGLPNGGEPAMCWYMFPNQAVEIYVQYYVKYSSNYYFHSVDNKQTYYFIGPSNSNFYISTSGSRHISMVTQTYATDRHNSNTGYDPVIEPGRWYKISARFVMNSPGVKNGIAQIWLDDKLVINKNTIGYRSSAESGQGFREMQITPVFGGMAPMTKPAEDYQWYDHTIVSTERMGGFPILPVPIPSDNKITPNPPENLKVD